LPQEEQRKIEEEKDRIRKLRATFERDPERKYLVLHLSHSMSAYFRRQHTYTDTSTASTSASSVPDPGFGMEANMMFWKDSQPHTLAGHPEEVPKSKDSH
jgi:hypothetical protein